MDLSRMGDWYAATCAYRLGDPRKLAKFIKENGVQVGIEADELSSFLLSKPDPRKQVKTETQRMLYDLSALFFNRDDLEKYIPLALAEKKDRLSKRLERMGWSADAREAAIEHRYRFMKDWKPDTNDRLFEFIGMRYGIDGDSVKKAYHRHKKKQAGKKRPD